MQNKNLSQLKKDLRKLANPEKAKNYARFFKTGKGEYGEGDKFLGVIVPDSRKIAKKYKDLLLTDVQKLLQSKIHEERIIAVTILVSQYERSNEKEKKRIYIFYIKNRKYINNWDLVDGSAPKIMGSYLMDKPKDIIYKFAKSKKLWERRIAIMTTLLFINNDEYNDTFKISKILLYDEHDLIHKAVGWMLREVGNRDRKVEERFLKKHYNKMPRTMLRYAIEKFPETLRQKYLKGEI